MQWGILLCTEAVVGDLARLALQAVQDATAYTSAGASMLVAGDHPAGGETRVIDPVAMLAAVTGQRTQSLAPGARLKVMPSLVAGATAPQVAETRLASLDALAGSAVPVALAAGYREADFRAAERPFADRFRARWRLTETLLASGRQVWSCSVTPRSAERAAQLGAGVYLGPGLDPRRYRELRDAALSAPLAVRIDLDLSHGGLATARRAKYDRHQSRGYPAVHAFGGGPAAIHDQLGEMVAELAPSLTVLRVTWPGEEPLLAARHRDLFLTEIAPGLKAI
jgi:hypothetical protein